MSAINRTSMIKNYHTFCLFHVGKPDKYIEFEGRRLLPPPSVFNIVGGQMTNYLGYNLFGVYRPVRKQEDYGYVNPATGIPYDINEVEIIVEKSKPQGVGQEGTFNLWFDKDRQQYYEKIDGKVYYCGEYNKQQISENPQSALKPSTSFDDSEDDIF